MEKINSNTEGRCWKKILMLKEDNERSKIEDPRSKMEDPGSQF